MRLKHLTLSFLTLIISGIQAQTIKSISIHGALKKPNGQDLEVEFYSSTDATANKSNIVAITISMNKTKGEYIVFDQTGTSTAWEVNQASNPTSGSWKDLCHYIKENDNACSGDCEVTYYMRHVGTSTGTETNTIKIALSSNKNGACTYSSSDVFSIDATVNKVSSTGIYTWSEPQSGTDSSYKIAGNWTPSRDTKKTDDILVVNLADKTPRNTTIDISNLTETIGQFKIYPHNNVTFKCSTNSAWTVGNSSSLTGVDFVSSDSSFIRKTGSGELEIIIPANNSLDIDGSITTIEGDLLFSGAGSHNISGNIKTVGGLLNFTPSSGTNTLFLDGKKQILSGNSYVSGSPTLYIDTNCNVTVGTNATSPVDTLTLQRTLPIYSVLTLNQGTRIISNTPASISAADWNAWEPYLQLKAPQYNQATKRGQLNVMPTSSEIVGGSQFEIYGTNVRAYRMIGLPFENGVHLSQFSDDIDLTGVVTGNNKDSFETNCSVCKTSAFHWNEATGAWNGYASGSSATVLPKGKGTLVFFRGRKQNGLGDTSALANEGIIDFKGKLQVGNYNYTLSKSGTAGTALDGFNLIANPYPCNITFDEVYKKHNTKMRPRFRTYDARRKTYNTWDSTVSNNSPGKSGARKFSNASSQQAKIIAAGAAFFVEAQTNGETVSFTESMKTPFAEAKTAHHGVQELIETSCNELQLSLSYQSDTLFDSDNVTIQFDINDERVSHAANETDVVEFYAGYLGIGTLSPEGTWLTIDRRPRIALPNETYTIPLKTVYPKDALKDVIIDFNFCSDKQSNYRIQLIDKVKNTSTEITDLASYPYQISNTEEKKDNRFELLFSGIDQQNHTNRIEQQKLVVFPNPAENKTIHISNAHNIDIREMKLINTVGKTVMEFKTDPNQTLHTLNLDSLQSGMYFLQVSGLNLTETHPILLK